MLRLIKYFCISLILGSSLTAAAQYKGEPPPVKEGIKLTRTYLIRKMLSSDSSMVFTQTANVDNLPHYIGVDKEGTSIEFVGEDNRLKRAIFTFKFTTNLDVNTIQYTRMSYFAYLIAGKDGVTWLEDCLSGFAADPTTPIDKTGKFSLNLNGFCKYMPSDKFITVTFTD